MWTEIGDEERDKRDRKEGGDRETAETLRPYLCMGPEETLK